MKTIKEIIPEYSRKEKPNEYEFLAKKGRYFVKYEINGKEVENIIIGYLSNIASDKQRAYNKKHNMITN